MDKITERVILLENLRISRCIMDFKADENLITACRTALKYNIAAYDGFMQKKRDEAAERRAAKKRGGG